MIAAAIATPIGQLRKSVASVATIRSRAPTIGEHTDSILEERRRYYPTRRLFEVGSAIATHDPIVERLASVLEKLRDETGETILLGQRQDRQIIYLQVLESPQMIRYAAPVGAIRPLSSTAIGKAFLGEMTDEELTRILAELDRPQVTETTITNPEHLLADIQRDLGTLIEALAKEATRFDRG